MLYTDVRVRVWTDGGPITLTDQVLGVQVQDGLDSLPQGTVLLPLHRTVSPTSRRRYSELIQVGDLALVEMLAWDGERGDWEAVLHGPVTAVEEAEGLGPEGEAVTRLGVASMAHILAQDAVARWLWYGHVAGWKVVESQLSIQEMLDDPASVAYRYLTKIAFHHANWQNGGTLQDFIHLDMDGLKAVGPFALELQLVEGSHLEIVRRLLDPPLHEVFVTTDRAANLRGRLTSRAGQAPGEGQAATVVRWRAAPYPYPGTGEWERLPLHRLEGTWQPVRGRSAAKTDAPIRNFFLLYPAFTFADEYILLAMGVAVANRRSIARYGYRPLKARTLLVHNEALKPEKSVEEHLKTLTQRMAAQWNRLQEMEAGTLELPLAPWIRPGERVRFSGLWGYRELLGHVRARQLTWDPRTGGRMSLAVERALPPEVYGDPGWFGEGLEVVRAGSEVLAQAWKEEKRR
ncbi:hypothetical protein KZX47_12780 [Thermus sp. SYSU G05001]|uniref:Uncharacterized protein n=1 Tax=Thermus brevis TaxID=2862456 RepID=A0ABS7A4B5_9DEIN|nr:hypothetical protein [Thermus brevis]MBW6396019.1 hypothetical protein [Thermus brevis]